MTETPPGTDPLVVSPPSLAPARAERIASRHFGLDGTATELGGERDQNFRIETGEEAYVLKVSNPTDGPEALDLQTAALDHLSRTAPDLPVMRQVSTTDGEAWAAVETDGATRFVRLFTLVPGRSPSGEALDEDALYHYGGTVARVGRGLRGFHHPHARYELLWDLRHASELRSLLDSLDDPDRRDLAEHVLDRVDDRVAPAFDSLRAQVIHNDLTLDNVLFDSGGQVSGIVDVGDLTHTALVCDLAIALASVMHRRDDPLAAAESVIEGYVSVTPLEETESRLLADLVAARLLSWGVIVAWRSAEHPDKTDHTVAGVDDGWALLRSLVETGLDRVGRRLRTAALSRNVPFSRRERTELLDRRRAVLGDAPLFYRDPVHVTGGEGVWLYDPEGRRYLDAYNNVQVVGHGHPAIADAVGGQSRKLTTNTRYLHESVVSLSERLLETLPDELDRVILLNSGSEANDLAWRLATAATGREGAIVSDNAYHGITDATMALSPASWPDGAAPDHVETVPAPARSEHSGVPAPGAGAVDSAIDRLAQRGREVAGFVFDPLFTSDGIYPADPGRLAAMATRVREAGGLVIADEVQAGHGRTGTALWGFEAADVVPDVVTMGKPMGNGHPVAAVATRSDVESTLRDRTGLFSTFGGNPVSSAAALAVLEVIDTEGLVAQSRDVGSYLGAELATLAETHAAVGEVRQRGLMVGVELVRDPSAWTPASEGAQNVVERLRQRRILVGSSGPAGNVLKIRPPLVFEREHADRLVDALDGAIGDEFRD